MLEKREAGTSVRSVWLWTVKMDGLLISFSRNSCLLFLVKDKKQKNIQFDTVLGPHLRFSLFNLLRWWREEIRDRADCPPEFGNCF